jgi:TonB dependent receptor
VLDFSKNVPVVNYAKLRLSYGALGNQVVPGGPYPFVSRFNPRVDNYFNGQYTNGTALQNVQNIDIGWETSIQKNIGIDLGLLKNKLNVSFDYYEKQINDMIVDLPLVLYAGLANAASTVPTNVGSMINKGWELSINYKNKIGKDFNYNVTVNLSDVSNMVTNLNGQTVFTSEGLVAREGFPANGFLGYRTSGLFQRGDNTTTPAPTFRTPTNPAKEGDVRYLDLNGDGVVNANDDRTLFGFNFPRYEYSVDLNASYKGFDISVFVFGVGKRGNYMSGIGVNPFSGGWVSSGLETMLNRWTPNNTNTNYPRLGGVGNFETSDFWMRDGAFMRIRHITLGYNLPKSILAKANMQQCRFYVSVVNPFTFSNYEPGFDPEPTNNASSFYPIMKTYTAGFNIKF